MKRLMKRFTGSRAILYTNIPAVERLQTPVRITGHCVRHGPNKGEERRVNALDLNFRYGQVRLLSFCLLVVLLVIV